MRPTRAVIQSVVGITAAVYLVSFILEGAPTGGDWFAPFGAAVAAASLVLLAFDHFLWRMPLVRQHIARRPYLRGTWTGVLRSHYEDPATGQRIPPDDDVYFVIRQRYWSISTRLITKESKSFSIVALLDRAGEGEFGLFSIYRNTPRLHVRHRSPIHHGSLMLDVSGDPPNCLEGYYWTDRRTMGELELTARYDELVGDHKAGQELKRTKQPRVSRA
jgi:hypothetical protein